MGHRLNTVKKHAIQVEDPRQGSGCDRGVWFEQVEINQRKINIVRILALLVLHRFGATRDELLIL
jgi:hypothetical protein